MSNENDLLLSIVVTYPVLLGAVGLLLCAIFLLKKSRRYGGIIRRLIIGLFVLIFSASAYLLFKVLAICIPQTSASPGMG